MTNAVEQVVAALAPVVRAKGRHVEVTDDASIDIKKDASDDAEWITTLWCQDVSQAKRLAKMMRGDE